MPHCRVLQRSHLLSLRRRQGLLVGAAGAASLVLPSLQAAEPPSVVLSTPGPGSSVSTVPELAVRLGADRAEGLALRLRFTGGGGIAVRDLYSGNAQFGVFGLSAAMHENLSGLKMVALAAVEDRVPMVLLVRQDLKAAVRRVADLAGRTVGVHSNSVQTVTNSQQVLALLLRRAGLAPDAVRVIAAGQSWEPQAAALKSRLVDALISEEPFGLRMEDEGLAFALVRLGLPGPPLGLPGEGFLRGTLIALADLPTAQPALAERMVRTIQRTLAWRKDRPADEVVGALGLAGAEARAFRAMLSQYPSQFSPDGRFSEAQLAESERFFVESSGGTAQAASFRIASMVVDRWAGRKP